MFAKMIFLNKNIHFGGKLGCWTGVSYSFGRFVGSFEKCVPISFRQKWRHQGDSPEGNSSDLLLSGGPTV